MNHGISVMLGVTAAKEIMKQGITLEEYLEQQKDGCAAVRLYQHQP